MLIFLAQFAIKNFFVIFFVYSFYLPNCSFACAWVCFVEGVGVKSQGLLFVKVTVSSTLG